MKKKNFLLSVVTLFLISFFFGCAEDKKDQNVELVFQSSYLESEKMLTIEFTAKDNNAGDDSAVSAEIVASFAKSAQYTFNSDSSFELSVGDKKVVIEESGGTYKVSVTADVTIQKNDEDIQDLSQLIGDISLKLTGELGEQSLQLSGKVTYTSSTEESPQGGTPSEDLTQNADNGNNVQEPYFKLVSTNIEPNIPSAGKYTLSIKAEYTSNDSPSDEDLINAFETGVFKVNFDSDDYQAVINSPEVSITNNNQKIITTSIVAEFRDNNFQNVQLDQLNENINFTYTINYLSLNEPLSGNLMLFHDFSHFKANMNIALAGYAGSIESFDTLENSSTHGITPPGFNVSGKRYVSIDAEGTTGFFSASASVPFDGKDNEGLQNGQYLFTDSMKDFLYTSELKVNDNFIMHAFVACVFLPLEPLTHKDRMEQSIGGLLTDYSSLTTLESYDNLDSNAEKKLYEIFYVGDGKDSTDKSILYKVPLNAEKIYCGYADKAETFIKGYDDNSENVINFYINAF